MIFSAPPSKNSPKVDSFQINNLEALTGADYLVSLMDRPPPNTKSKVWRHLEDGDAVLVQLKIGLDLSSSVGPRMRESIERMRSAGARHYQCVLLPVGLMTADRDMGTVIDGREAKYAGKSYWAVHNALRNWNFRGGSVAYPLSRLSLVEPYLKGLEQWLQTVRNNPVKEAWAHRYDYPDVTDEIAQVVVPVGDWRVTFASMPKVGLGHRKLNTVRNMLLETNRPDTLLSAAELILNHRVPGIGKVIKGRFREHLGLAEGESIVTSVSFPVTLTFPRGAEVACVDGQWVKGKDGRVTATYNSPDELAIAIASVGKVSPAIWAALGVDLE